MNRKVAIIGGGASGMLLALMCQDMHHEVMIFEQNPRLGKKLLATGNGRCNFTNLEACPKDYNHPDFVEYGLTHFSSQHAIEYFKSLGIEPFYGESSKMYPLSLQSSTFLDVFLYEFEQREIPLFLSTRIVDLKYQNNQFLLFDQNHNQYEATDVVISTGGMALPSTGSNGGGYTLAHLFGHHTTKLHPSLVKLLSDYPYLKQVQGLKLETTVTLMQDEMVIAKDFGDFLFTEKGVSGPTVLNLSKAAIHALEFGKSVCLVVDLLPSMTEDDILNRFYLFSEKTVSQSLVGLIHKRLIHPLLQEFGVLDSTILSSLPYLKLRELAKFIKVLKIKITGSYDFMDAQVTDGGIDILEVSNTTLESKKRTHLYFTGEVLDIDGRCGGFNLQWAWSSAYLVATALNEERK